MSYGERHTVTLTTNASGDATGYTPVVTGRIVSIQYVKTDFANGIDVAVTGDQTTLAVWTGTDVNASATVYPLIAATLVGGSSSTLTEVPVMVVNERVKVVVSNGGDTKTGTFHVIVG